MAVPEFHAMGHNLFCQLKNGLLYTVGLGKHGGGEEPEYGWARINQQYTITMSLRNRHDVYEFLFARINTRNADAFPDLLLRLWDNTLRKRDDTLAAKLAVLPSLLSALGVATEEDALPAVRAYVARILATGSPEDGLTDAQRLAQNYVLIGGGRVDAYAPFLAALVALGFKLTAATAAAAQSDAAALEASLRLTALTRWSADSEDLRAALEGLARAHLAEVRGSIVSKCGKLAYALAQARIRGLDVSPVDPRRV